MTLARTAFAALLLAGSVLSAQDVRYGIQGHISLPQGDLKDVVDNKLGLGGGAHVTLGFDQHVIRPRFDYTHFLESNRDGLKLQTTATSLGADYLYYTEGKDKGFYLTVGASAIRWDFQVKLPGFEGKEHTTRLGLSAGVGYQWTKDFGTEVRYIQSSLDKDANANSITVGATYRF